jgi:Derlin-2/3
MGSSRKFGFILGSDYLEVSVWRLLTAFVYAGPFSFNFAMHAYVLYDNCRRYEASPFNTGTGRNSADFLWLILLAMAALLGLAYVFDMMVLSDAILYVIMYVWSRREPEGQLSMFGFRFKAIYTPWVYVAIRLIMGGSITEPLMGISIGHLYFYLVEVYPAAHGGRSMIRTPAFCSAIVEKLTGLSPWIAPTPGTRGRVEAPPRQVGRPNEPTPVEMPSANNVNNNSSNSSNMRYRGAAENRPGSYNWGQGRTLGAN